MVNGPCNILPTWAASSLTSKSKTRKRSLLRMEEIPANLKRDKTLPSEKGWDSVPCVLLS